MLSVLDWSLEALETEGELDLCATTIENTAIPACGARIQVQNDKGNLM